MPFPFVDFIKAFASAINEEFLYELDPPRQATAITQMRPPDPYQLFPARYPRNQYRLCARTAPNAGPLKRSPGVWKGQRKFRFKSICTTSPISGPRYDIIRLALRLSVHLVEAGFTRRNERREAQYFLLYLARHCIRKGGQLDFNKGFGGRNCLRALVYLGEERARRYPFVLSSQRQSGRLVHREPPMFFEISIESLLHLAGLTPRRARVLGLMPFEGETWKILIARLRKSEKGQFRLFGDLIHRYFGGNQVLLARPVIREPNWRDGMPLNWPCLVGRVLNNLSLAGDFTRQLSEDVGGENGVPSGMLQVQRHVIANWA